MELRQKTINDIEFFFEKKSSSVESISFFIIKIRLLLEITNQKSKYKILNHYCNWFLHKSLDQGISPVIIKEISCTFSKQLKKNDFIVEINEILSVKKLIEELKEVLYINVGFKHQYTFENDQFWIKFLTLFLSEIKIKPLLLIKNNVIENKAIEEIDFSFSVYGIQLTDNDGKIVIEILSKEFTDKKKHFYIEFAIFKYEK
jgi:hypothetical protein